VNNGNYLIPANSKKGQLIFNFFRPIDLIIFGVGLFISFILIVSIGVGELWQTIIVLLPAGISALLIAPIPNYHNVLVFLTSIYGYLTNRRFYIWKGWCASDGNDTKQ